MSHKMTTVYIVRDAEIINVPFLAVLAGCSARRSERSVAGHTSEEQHRNAPVSAVKNGILAVSASLISAYRVGYPSSRNPTRGISGGENGG